MPDSPPPKTTMPLGPRTELLGRPGEVMPVEHVDRYRQRKREGNKALSAIVTCVRLPFGLIASVVLIACFLPETVYMTIYIGIKFSFLLLFAERRKLESAWRNDRLIRKYPKTVRAIEDVWRWVLKH